MRPTPASPLPRSAVFALVVGLLSGCVSVTPRFSPPVAHAFARDVMRKMETDQVQLYYPEVEKAEATRTLGRLDACVRMLRKLPLSTRKQDPLLIYLTRADFNNAYVYPAVGGTEQYMLLPSHLTLELFNWFELGVTQIGDVSCHEAVHAVHLQQTEGFWWAINLVFGEVLAPNALVDSWFTEGLATYYEGRLDRHVGRSRNPIWHALFLSGVAERGGKLGPGDLNAAQREMLPVGGNYLVGMHFVEYLARRFGERKLWELIDLQAESIFSPLFLTLRFKAVFGESIGALLDDYSAELTRTVKDRVRPASQQVIDPDMGYLARLAASRSDGALAALVARFDEVTRLEVREANGALRFSRALKPLFPIRPYLQDNPELASGLSFSPDGGRLYLVIADTDSDGGDISRLLELSSRDGSLLRQWTLGPALGGVADPAGDGYVFISVEAQTSNLVRLDLKTGERRMLTHFALGQSVGAPDVAPDGRVAFAVRGEGGMNLALLETDGRVHTLTHDANFDYFPRWVDARHLAFVREPANPDDALQVNLLDLATGAIRPVTQAPFMAFDPVITRSGQVAFLNRQGWHWTLDQTALPAIEASAAGPSKLAGDEPPVESATGAVASADAVVPISEAVPPVLADHPFRPFDHFFVPELRAPYVLPIFMSVPGSLLFGVTVGASFRGEDRLGLHTWVVDVNFDTFTLTPNATLGYGNYQLAPLFLSVVAARSAYLGTTDTGLHLAASRPLWTTEVSVGVDAMQHDIAEIPGVFNAVQMRLVGPSASVSDFVGDSSPYGGTQRGFGVSASGALYPRALGSSVNLADLRGEVLGYVPLPIRARHSLRLDLIAHGVFGAPAGLLQVGGIPPNFPIFESGNVAGGNGPAVPLPNGISFVEGLRGYEDHALRANNAAIAEARYRYVFPIDKGFASVLYLFPYLFFRQVDVEAFGSGAALDLLNDPNANAPTLHRAVGAELAVRASFGGIPLSLFYQYARRFDDGLGSFHLVGINLQ